MPTNRKPQPAQAAKSATEEQRDQTRRALQTSMDTRQ